MLFNTSHAIKYLAAAVIASLLQGISTVPPVFAEAAAKKDATVAQGTTANAAKKDMKTNAAVYTSTADHSAEFKPVKNEFLKEGEGVSFSWNWASSSSSWFYGSW